MFTKGSITIQHLYEGANTIQKIEIEDPNEFISPLISFDTIGVNGYLYKKDVIMRNFEDPKFNPVFHYMIKNNKLYAENGHPNVYKIPNKVERHLRSLIIDPNNIVCRISDFTTDEKSLFGKITPVGIYGNELKERIKIGEYPSFSMRSHAKLHDIESRNHCMVPNTVTITTFDYVVIPSFGKHATAKNPNNIPQQTKIIDRITIDKRELANTLKKENNVKELTESLRSLGVDPNLARNISPEDICVRGENATIIRGRCAITLDKRYLSNIF